MRVHGDPLKRRICPVSGLISNAVYLKKFNGFSFDLETPVFMKVLNDWVLFCELWLNLGDGVNQAANLISGATSIPSLNFTPLMTFGN